MDKYCTQIIIICQQKVFTSFYNLLICYICIAIQYLSMKVNFISRYKHIHHSRHERSFVWEMKRLEVVFPFWQKKDTCIKWGLYLSWKKLVWSARDKFLFPIWDLRLEDLQHTCLRRVCYMQNLVYFHCKMLKMVSINKH